MGKTENSKIQKSLLFSCFPFFLSFFNFLLIFFISQLKNYFPIFSFCRIFCCRANEHVRDGTVHTQGARNTRTGDGSRRCVLLGLSDALGNRRSSLSRRRRRQQTQRSTGRQPTQHPTAADTDTDLHIRTCFTNTGSECQSGHSL